MALNAGDEPRPLQVVILFFSRLGVVRLLAERVAEGVRDVSDDIVVTMLEVDDAPITDQRRRAILLEHLTLADAIIVGSPAYFGSMASPIKRVFEDCLVASGAPPAVDTSRPWRAPQLRDKIGAAFTSSATPHGGNEQALHSILTLFMHVGMLVVTPGQQEPILERAEAPYGPTAVSGATADRLPDALAQTAAFALGQRVARVASWMKRGRTDWERAHARTPALPARGAA